ncbi:MAG: aminotransferase class III-fold pyridoxal phosphate-dependent enzyme [Sedimentisphaerales bacterium]|nr:aminotransferase class III-fold pyridoxal phosphate-dependent enzyme [Sedimentisphaerales bacterium]
MAMSQNVNARYKKSLELYSKAEKLFPYGTQLWSRSPHLVAYGQAPIYFERAKGSHFWDVDGNEFIDTSMGVGPIVLGHCYDAVDNAAKAQIDKGILGSINNAIEIDMAEALCDLIPCADMVKFCKGGGDADAMAVRMARSYTGKDIVAFCGYHGWHDWYISANLASGSLDSHLLPGINPTGVPKALAGTTVPFKYNDLDSLRSVLQSKAGQVACIIMEATRFNLPKPGYLEGVRALADEHKCVLIFDEVVTGFRLPGGSAQKYFGVTPDLATFGKAIANGYPLAAVGGKREIMETQGDNFISSTYFSDTVGLAAGLATTREMLEKSVFDVLEKKGRQLIAGLESVIAKHDLKMKVNGQPSHFALGFDYGSESAKIATLYMQESVARGMYPGSHWYMCYSHTDEDIAKMIEAADGSLAVVAEALTKGNVDEVLKAPIKAAGFNRMV